MKALGRRLRGLYDVVTRKPLSWAIIDKLETIREREEAPRPPETSGPPPRVSGPRDPK